MIRVLVIDDSAFMRKALSLMIDQDPQLEVIGTARDGKMGLAKVLQQIPDVVTVDLEMPRTDGLTCIQMIMEQRPTPILVVSSKSLQGAQETFKALALGAVDYIPKPQAAVIEINQIAHELVSKIKAIAKSQGTEKLGKLRTIPEDGKRPDHQIVVQKPAYYDLSETKLDCVALGVSTGGPPVVEAILRTLPAEFPCPLVIAQHMPPEFTGIFAERLDKLCTIQVKEAEAGETLQVGTAYIGRGGKHLVVKRQGQRVVAQLQRPRLEQFYHPSADVLFASVAQVYGAQSLALILTGMGRDGTRGLQAVYAKGGAILAQDQASSVVFGMPQSAIRAQLVSAVLDVSGLIKSLATITSQVEFERTLS